MAHQETPISASSSSEQALLEGVGVTLASDKSQNAHARQGDFSAAAMAPKIEDPEGQYSADHYGQNAPPAPVPDSIQTWTSIDQEYKENFEVLELVDMKDHGSYIILENQKSEDHLEDYNDSDEDDLQVNGKSFDQNISSLGTDEVELSKLSENRLQEDFSPSATPNDISVPKLTTSSFEPLQESEKVISESVIQTGDSPNIVTANDERKEDEESGGIVLDKMAEGGTNKFSSTFGVVTDKLALAATGPDTSPTTTNDVRLAVPSLEPLLEPLLKRAKVIDGEILLNAEHTSSSFSAK